MKSTYSYLAKRIIIPVITVWLLAMILITIAVAQDVCVQLELGAMDRLQAASHLSVDPEIPGAMEDAMLRNLGFTYYQLDTDVLIPFLMLKTPDSIGSDDPRWGDWERVYGFQAATAYYDSDGNPMFYSGDWLSFSYETKEGHNRYGYIDLNTLDGGSELADQYINHFVFGDSAPFNMGRVKLTGWMDGNRMDVLRIHADYSGPVKTVYERDAESLEGVSYIHTGPSRYYGDVDLWGMNYSPGSDFTADGQHFDSVVDVLKAPEYHSQYNLFNTLIHRKEHFTFNGQDYTVAVAVQCFPLKYAAIRLHLTYFFSLSLLISCLSLILKGIRKKLIDPMQTINIAFGRDLRQLSEYADSPLAELKVLGTYYNEKQDRLHSLTQEKLQLQTALDYAKNAEENRRKLVSALAHELKTPLAVIHSYAEGLQEGIAPEQTEHYLQVITEETERMDALVLQMLDLSRLEAGKAKLRQDRFTLTEVTEKVLQKLELAAREKQLEVNFLLRENCAVVADRVRIEEAITNLLTNAIKYTPAGGKIRIKVFSHINYAHFRVENTGDHLPTEVLEKLWDSFYRADSARSGEGTGLGLTIVKTVISLHNGRCQAENIKDGVAFGFQLPL